MTRLGGPIPWMARNRVAANLLMLGLIVGGLIVSFRIQKEIFPRFDLDRINVRVAYPGASPEEVEEGIVLAVEERVRSLDGVKRVTSTSQEGSGSVTVELLLGAGPQKMLQDVKSEIDRITSFPEEAEEPEVSLVTSRELVLTIVLFGGLGEQPLRDLAERVREELLQDPRITMVELAGVKPLEISIEVPQAALRAHGLTLDEVAGRIRRGAIELPGGAVKTDGGEILLRTAERRDFGREFRTLPVVTASDGTEVTVGDLATVVDGFADVDQNAFYDGKPAVRVNVFRVGEQSPLELSDAVHDTLPTLRARLPDTVDAAVLLDISEVFRDRISLLLRNATLGLILVVLVLGLFLKIRLAFWVTLGIPVSVFGALFLLPGLGVSINMVSLAAFILTLGIVVDDAIVIGESIYERRERGVPAFRASVEGARQVAVPVVFGVLTTMAAFAPLLAIPGVMGKVFSNMPLVVLPVLFFSLVESLFILPAHLNHEYRKADEGVIAAILRMQERFANRLQQFIDRVYTPGLEATIRNRYLTASIGVAILVLTVGLVAGGRIPLSFMPKIDTDLVVAAATAPYGTPMHETERYQKRIVEAAHRVIDRYGEGEIARGIYTQLGNPRAAYMSGPIGGSSGIAGSHLTDVQVFLVPSEERAIPASRFAREWREEIGAVPGLESLTFDYSTGPSSAPAIDVELRHPDIEVLRRAGEDLAATLASFAGVTDIDDGFQEGKPQLDLEMRPAAQSLGLTAESLGRQIRHAFYGAEVLRQQRGRNEVKVMVRLPEGERRRLHTVEELVVRTPAGGEMPLYEAAEVTSTRAYTEIRRADGRRVLNVTADTVPGVANPGEVIAGLVEGPLPELARKYPGLRYGFEGEQREMRESVASLRTGFLLALVAIFGLLAVPFRSYVQPLIVMAAIPFGVVGAVIGHVLMGYELSVISMMGMVALSGVVVNDSLVLLDAANQTRRGGLEPERAIVGACLRRFRPILLTSLTTFFGLLPMIFERSMQAKFLVPMAISLGYGILFVTVIVLLLVPSLYLIVEDLRRLVHTEPQAEIPGEPDETPAE